MHFIQSVYTKKEFRGMGVFKALFNFVKTNAEKDRVPLKLYADIKNLSAIEVYKKLGMKDSETIFLKHEF